MRHGMLILGLSAATLVAFAASSAIADESKDDHVVIVKCAEANQPGAVPTVVVGQASAGFEIPASCDLGGECAECLATLIRDPFDCEGDDEFTSNVAVVQQSDPAVTDSQSIEKYVFACGLPRPAGPSLE